MSQLSRTERLDALRSLMREYGINAYIINSTDPHMSEYVSSKYMRREFMTDFYGSQGICLITESEAHLIVDGRYVVEAKKIATPEYTVHLIKKGFFADIVELLDEGKFDGILGLDTEVTSWLSFRALFDYLNSSDLSKRENFKIKLLNTNLVDKLRPKIDILSNNRDIYLHNIEYSGETSKSKVQKILREMKRQNARVLFISSLTQISWLLNLRGSDVQFTPVFMGYIILEIFHFESRDSIDEIPFKLKLFVNVDKILGCRKKLEEEFHTNISIIAIEDILKELECSIKESSSYLNKDLFKIWLPEEFSNIAAMETFYKSINQDENTDLNYCEMLINFCNHSKLLLTSESPILLERGIKNEIELKGMRECHIYDGLAVSKFLFYLTKSYGDGSLFKKKITEWDLSQKLLEFRKQQPNFVYPSFDTISSIGENGAIIHYRPSEKESALIRPDMYLCDSGGQYYTGTTDITRTLFLFGKNDEKPTKEHIEIFTRVLIGFIRLHKAVFPIGTNGNVLDVLARTSLWEIGLDYLHGTGHGVGSFLSVHEEPWSISYKTAKNFNPVPLKEGAVVSIEPGYYKEGEFGVRIENLVEVVEAKIDNEYEKAEKYLSFNPLTFVPIQKELIDVSLLAEDELNWLNWYHEKTLENLEPLIEGDSEFLSWLVQACSPIYRNVSVLPIPKTLYQ